MPEQNRMPAQLDSFFAQARKSAGNLEGSPGLALRELVGLRIFSLEWRSSSAVDAALARSGFAPLAQGCSSTRAYLQLLAVAPNRLRALFPAAQEEMAMAHLARLAAGVGKPEDASLDPQATGAALVELTCGLVVVEIVGEAVGEVLASHCPADLDPRTLTPGQHLRSHLAGHAALIEHRPKPGSYRLHLDRSLAHSCLCHLTRAAAPFGIAFLPATQPADEPQAGAAAEAHSWHHSRTEQDEERKQ